MTDYEVKDMGLAAQGKLNIEYAERNMPIMLKIKERFANEQPFNGMTIGLALHVTKETAVLVETLSAAGAQISWSGCNPLSTQDDIAAALVDGGSQVYAWHGMNTEDFYWCIDKTLEQKPTLTLDDGADLIFTLHNKHQDLCEGIIGGTEETTTGVHRLRAMGDDGKLLLYYRPHAD